MISQYIMKINFHFLKMWLMKHTNIITYIAHICGLHYISKKKRKKIQKMFFLFRP